MKMFTADELRSISDKAVEEAKNGLREADKIKAEARRLAQEREKLRAETILHELPERLLAVAATKRRCTVFRLESVDYASGSRFQDREVGIGMLDGAATIVAETCRKLGYRVSVEFDHDGGGMDSWHNLVVEW